MLIKSLLRVGEGKIFIASLGKTFTLGFMRQQTKKNKEDKDKVALKSLDA
jgi:hypothetical protein